MDKKTKDYFDDIISLAKTSVENVTHQIDVTPRRAILEIKAKFGELRNASVTGIPACHSVGIFVTSSTDYECSTGLRVKKDSYRMTCYTLHN